MPRIRLTFPNPLNTSVQVGDTAYFSNPIEVGVKGGQWASTTTPHLTSEQQDIIKIGEIMGIEPWDGGRSMIYCDMPQILFNKYFADIKPSGCITTTQLVSWCIDKPIFPDLQSIFEEGFKPGNHNKQWGELGCIIVPTYGASSSCLDVPGDPASQYKYLHLAMGSIVFGVGFQTDNPIPGMGGSAADVLGHFINQPAPGFTGYSYPNVSNWEPGHGLNLTLTSSYADLETEVMANGGWNNFVPGTGPNSYWGDQGYHSHQPTAPWSGGNPSWMFGWTPGCYPPDHPSSTSTICEDGSFIMFSKDNKVNMSSMLGYYASIEYRNDSLEKAELFKVGAEVFESSK